MIRTVFLDLDDTILDFQKSERVAIRKTFEILGVPHSPEVIERYIEINVSLWQALERGELTREGVLHGRFERLFSELKMVRSPKETQELYQSLLAKEYDFLPGGRELLSELKKSGRYRLYMATNGIPEVQEPRIEKSGVGEFFDGVFISERIGYQKPDKRFFDACFERIDGFKKEEAIIVGDSLSSDIKGGINAGILTCHFNPKDKPYSQIKPDYKIKNLSELIPLLDNIK